MWAMSMVLKDKKNISNKLKQYLSKMKSYSNLIKTFYFFKNFTKNKNYRSADKAFEIKGNKS